MNISPKVTYGVPECYVAELHAYDFVIKGALFVPDPVYSPV